MKGCKMQELWKALRLILHLMRGSKVEQFLHAALFEPHLERVVVLRDGIRLLQRPQSLRKTDLGSPNLTTV